MDSVKTGRLIRKLRTGNSWTQQQLAERLGVSDKAVSKWERGWGCPDVAFLAGLSKIFNVELEKLLLGELEANEILGGNMKKMHFYVCPDCQNIVTALADTTVSCCGKKRTPLQAQKAGGEEKLSVETVEDELFITSAHPMARDHYISFVALLTGDGILLRKQYPEWDLQVRIPALPHGRLLWYCTRHGLFYQEI